MQSLKKPSVYIGLGIVALLIVAYFLTLSSGTLQGDVVAVRRGDIVEEVFVTGAVRAARKVSLSFDRGGMVRSLPFTVGAKVEAGAILASLENGSEYAAVAESRALVAIEEADLAETKRGTREEEIQLREAETRKAAVSFKNSESRVLGVLTDAHSAAEEALNRYAAPFFLNDDTKTPRLTYLSGTQEAYDAEAKRLRAGQAVSDLQKSVQSGPASAQTLEEASEHLRLIQDLFITLGLTLRDESVSDAATLADYRSRVTSARSSLGGALASVQNLANAIRDGAAEFERSTRALALAKAGATPESLVRAEQTLAQAKAKLRNSEALLEKTLLRAPFRGSISSNNVEAGETIQAGKVIMEFLGTDGFTIEAHVPEADIAKIAVGAEAAVTLDAYGDAVSFQARVSQIEPASTEIEGVPTYKTTFSFEKQDPRFRSGLTANLTIKKLSKTNVLLLPSRAVTSEDGTLFVMKLLPDGTTKQAAVKTGARSGSREVEVIEGLLEGDRAIIPQTR